MNEINLSPILGRHRPEAEGGLWSGRNDLPIVYNIAWYEQKAVTAFWPPPLPPGNEYPPR